MSRARRRRESTGALAAVLGGAVTREQFAAAAAREGADGSPLARALLRRYLPSRAELAHVFACRNAPLRVPERVLEPAPQAVRLLDRSVLRRTGCLPLLVLQEVCVLAVEAGREEEAVAAVKAVLHRPIIPVLAERTAIQAALRRLPEPALATPRPLRPRGPSPTWERFESQVLRGAALSALAQDAPAE